MNIKITLLKALLFIALTSALCAYYLEENRQHKSVEIHPKQFLWDFSCIRCCLTERGRLGSAIVCDLNCLNVILIPLQKEIPLEEPMSLHPFASN